MNIPKTIDTLNTLIEINNERIKGYETAGQETKELNLQLLFSQFTQTSEKCKTELTIEITKLGGSIIEGTGIVSKFFRAWMDVKTVLSGSDDKVMLASVVLGEHSTLETYDSALKEDTDTFTINQHNMILDQQLLIKSDLNKVKIIVSTLSK